MLCDLMRRAQELCLSHFGDGVYIRGIIEFSNVCGRECLYCGIRRQMSSVNRYVMSQEEILSAVEDGYNLGVRSFVLQSGESAVYSVDELSRVIEAIHQRCQEPVAVTLSIGEKSRQEYQQLFNAGGDRFLLRFESANPVVYRKNHPDSHLETRLEALANLKELGFETGTGFLVGIPFEEPDDFERNLQTLINFRPHMVGLGPFIPAKGTPGEHFKAGSVEKVLEAYSRIRLAFPQINLAAATALDSLVPNGRFLGLKAGANVYMPNLTPRDFRAHYQLYAKKTSADAFAGWKAQLQQEMAEFQRKPLWGHIGRSRLMDEPNSFEVYS